MMITEYDRTGDIARLEVMVEDDDICIWLHSAILKRRLGRSFFINVLLRRDKVEKKSGILEVSITHRTD